MKFSGEEEFEDLWERVGTDEIGELNYSIIISCIQSFI